MLLLEETVIYNAGGTSQKASAMILPYQKVILLRFVIPLIYYMHRECGRSQTVDQAVKIYHQKLLISFFLVCTSAPVCLQVPVRPQQMKVSVMHSETSG